MSQNEYLRGQADVAHLDPLAVVALRSFLDLCSDRPSETQKATFSRAGALHLSLLSHKRQALKVCVPLFLFSRRN